MVPPGREGQGHPYAFKGNRFYRVVHDFMIQTGTPTESVYGGHFPDDPGGLALPHNRPGLVSMAREAVIPSRRKKKKKKTLHKDGKVDDEKKKTWG